MIKEFAFQTRARTVDHLGREQIADCPTAISELWKNAFDAYARNVQLNLYDGDEPVAAIIDDGHGMNYHEFQERWLTVGTESKATGEMTPTEDRCGLRPRLRQGQKGIGRLSCANLGPLLLLVSKRKTDPFVASLIDWRLFENPFINLSDIFIPTVEFTDAEHVFVQLPNLAKALSENVTGGADERRKERVQLAWASFDKLHKEEHKGNPLIASSLPSREILSTISRIPFNLRHFQQWETWSGSCDHGTALLVSGINYDLRVQLNERVADSAAQAAKERFFETLSGFVDPFVDPSDNVAMRKSPQFTYSACVWEGDVHRVILGTEKQFDKRQVDDMEHRIEGQIDDRGVFTGRVRAFSELLPDNCVIEPPKDLTIPIRSDTFLGPFQLYIASMEFDEKNTTHSDMDFQRYKDLAKKYSGFMIYRDGLRVLPYGRTDNDFFEIESRRTKSAGREFWNHRQMFGRIAITRKHNRNLKDKAGREGLLDNQAAKTLKELVANILMRAARLYFGSSSEIRQELLPQISEANRRKRVNEETEKLRKRHLREFRTKLKQFTQKLPEFVLSIQQFAQGLDIVTEKEIYESQRKLDEFNERLSDFRLPSAPEDMGRLKEQFADYRQMIATVKEELFKLGEQIDHKIEQIKPVNPRELLEKQLKTQTTQIESRIRQWINSIHALQQEEAKRIRKLATERNKVFHSEAKPLIHRFDTEKLSYAETSKLMDLLKQRIDQENSELFVPYIGTLESLQESIDLEHLATFGMEEISDLRVELERLNSLAQLGIAVEIIGHELQAYDDLIGAALTRLPEDVRETKAVKDIEFGYEGLTDQLRFLSPLRLAGQKIQRWITGAEIADYISEFFRYTLVKNKITLTSTDDFQKLRVFDQRARLYPVFINLVNNSIYWLGVSDNKSRQIILDVVGKEVVVSDNGPGVDPEDIDSLFRLFFTRKIRGGRGVGLYLCRANLTAGGHSIQYVPSRSDMPLRGANFMISFRGAEFNEE